MNGVINVLKPPGMTSHDVVQFIRKLTGQKKAGHTGTLDPGAAGVLPVCLGKATKIIQFMDHDKEYRAEITFGRSTSTGDTFGKVTGRADCSFVDARAVQTVLPEFTGEIIQVPPMTSAIKHRGKKLYELAREGKEVERKERRVKIYFTRLVEEFGVGSPCPRFLVDVGCSAGTYIRTFCSDLGERLEGCAYMSFLLRTRAGIFRVEESFTLEDLGKKKREGRLFDVPVDIDRALENLPAVHTGLEEARAVRNGNRIRVPAEEITGSNFFPGRTVRVYGPEGFLAVGMVLPAVNMDNKAVIQPVRVLVS